MATKAYRGPHVVLTREEIELVLDLLPTKDPDRIYDDIRMKCNKALDVEWEKAQWPKGRNRTD